MTALTVTFGEAFAMSVGWLALGLFVGYRLGRGGQ